MPGVNGQAAGRTAATAAPAGDEAATSPRPHRYRLRDWLVPIVPALAELVVGGYKIAGPSLWRDEAFTIAASQRPIGGILALLGHTDAVHGLYYLGMHFVIEVFGISAAAIRWPTVLAMSLTAAATAALGRRLARASSLPAPSITGLLAGLVVVAEPLTTWYAQDARPFALASLFAVVSTYALVLGVTERRRRWWAAYTAAVVLTGMFNLFALLLLAAHGTSLVIARGRAHRAPGSGATDPGLRSWLAAASAAVILLLPLIILGERQDTVLFWLHRPDARTVISLVLHFSGSAAVTPLVVALAVCGAVGGLGRAGELTLAVVSVPWLILPPLVLLAVSLLHPVYDERYVIFCIPALALLCAGGLTWLTRLVAATPVGKRSAALCLLPSAALAVALAAMLVGPQQAVVGVNARPDNLRAVSAVVAAHEHPGDAILYMPWPTRVLGMAYPWPFRRLRDIGLGESAVSSATLVGREVSAPVLARRFAGVHRVWVVRWRGGIRHPGSSALARQELALLGKMHLVGLWRVRTVVLSLYAAGPR
jgi:mannosyltransferase